MKLLLIALLCLFTSAAHADQITFSFVAAEGNAVDMTASKSAGMNSGPAENITISDTSKGEHLPLPGIFTSSAGSASSFLTTGGFVIATFTAGADNSVLITDPTGTDVLIAGTMQTNGALLAESHGGTGSFLGTFTVTQIDPDVLASFGLSGINPDASVAFTFGQDKLKGKTLDAVVGGGSVTVVATAVPVPELDSASLWTIGILALGAGILVWKHL